MPARPVGIYRVDLLRNIDIATIAIQFAVLLFSLSIHEASHAWMADRLGDYTARYLGRVTLNPIPHIDPIGTIVFPLLQFFINFPLIGWAKPVPINPIHLRNPQRDQIFISLAGPVSNLLAGFIAFGILVVLKLSWPAARGFIEYMTFVGHIPGNQSILAPILGILYYAMVINVLLAIFNIIPIPPLDGHWILYGLLPASAAATLERFGSYGFILLYALMFFGVFKFILIPVGLMITLLKIF
jgi:Zn-dependent protease